MAEQQEEAKWRQALKKPAGALPPNVVQKVVLPVAAVLLVAVFWTAQSGPGEDAVEQTEPEAVNENFWDQLRGRMVQDREQAAREQEIAANRAASEEQARQAQAAREAAAARAAAAMDAMAGRVTGGAAGAAGAAAEDLVLTEGEMELRERLRLEALERRTRSLRAPSLVQTFRDPDVRRTNAGAPETQPWLNAGDAMGGQQPSAANAPEGAPPPAPGLSLADPAALTAQMEQAAQMQQAMNEALLGGGGTNSPLREPQARTVPGVTGPEVAETAAPASVTTPADPPGVERVYEGSVLSAVLVNQLDGDFAGPVLAQVAIPFYSRDRQRVLVPRGTRLLGTAQAVGDQDQSRLAVGFHRMIWADGRWVDLSFHGLNQIGESALIDQVNRHYWSMFAAAGAVGVLAGFTMQGSNPYAGGAEGFRSGAGQGFGQSATQILQRFLNRMPTVTIRAGHRLRVWVTSDFLVPRPAPHPERMYR